MSEKGTLDLVELLVSCTLYMVCQSFDARVGSSFFPSENRTTMIIVGCTCGLAAAFAAPIGSSSLPSSLIKPGPNIATQQIFWGHPFQVLVSELYIMRLYLQCTDYTQFLL